MEHGKFIGWEIMYKLYCVIYYCHAPLNLFNSIQTIYNMQHKSFPFIQNVIVKSGGGALKGAGNGCRIWEVGYKGLVEDAAWHAADECGKLNVEAVALARGIARGEMTVTKKGNCQVEIPLVELLCHWLKK